MVNIHKILKEYWDYSSFRPMQEEIIRSVLEGKDTLALLPTGAGKSLCYQVPALALDGITLVISPLIALMKDQIEGLNKKGILAAAIYSGMSGRAIVQTLKNVAYGPYKLLYVSPERLETSLFKEYLPALDIQLIAVDEAHCISQWGYDFRPSFLRIAALREELPHVPILAVTASATSIVRDDICSKLLFKAPGVFRRPFTRENLSYSAIRTDAKLVKLVEIVSRVPGSVIVYCKSRKRTAEITGLLQMHGISAAFYHAGLSTEERNGKQQDWMENRTRVMVCTNAFGMGIDKPDVRLVMHADTPDCLENYYQEAGRAGRDGRKAYAILLYDEADFIQLQRNHEKKFPELEDIRKVYSALVNFLQLPAYSGEGQSYSFKFESFIQNFSLDPVLALSALKVLEADGWIDFNEKSFRPAQLVFTTTKTALYEFQNGHLHLEPLLTSLLRTYEGIFDFPCGISEPLLARLLRMEEQAVKKQLKEIAAYHIIDYAEQNSDPQIIFRRNRVPVDDFRIDLKGHAERKKLYIERVQQMIGYTATQDCRSQFINRYFGDEKDAPCGKCDNCIRPRADSLSKAEFEHIHLLIGSHLEKEPLSTSQLLHHLEPISKEKIWQVLHFLQAEKKLFVNEKGLLQSGSNRQP
jgi:ATP-dependent DNA helicase RecQ